MYIFQIKISKKQRILSS